MNKANLGPCLSEQQNGQIGEQSMLRRRQIVAIHLVQSGSDEIMVRCNGPRDERERDQRRDEKRGVEWAIFQEWAERRGGEGGHYIAQPRGKLRRYLIKMRPW